MKRVVLLEHEEWPFSNGNFLPNGHERTIAEADVVGRVHGENEIEIIKNRYGEAGFIMSLRRFTMFAFNFIV